MNLYLLVLKLLSKRQTGPAFLKVASSQIHEKKRIVLVLW